MAHQLTLNSTMLEELKAKAAALPDEKKIQESKSVTPDTNQQTVTPDGGYDGLAEVTVNAIPTGSVGNPTIDVNSSGVITATAAVDAGYVDGTDKTGTKQLTIQAAKTITPTKSSQTAVESGRYTTGAVIVAAIPNKYEDRTESLPQLNTVNGGTAASTMAEAVDNTEALMDDENILITQLQTKLEGMTYDSSNLQKKVIQPMVYDQIITADGAYQALSQVTVRGDSNLTATNIAKDVTIFGVTGTHEGGEDISAETAEYTELLADLETTIDAMSDAGAVEVLGEVWRRAR